MNLLFWKRIKDTVATESKHRSHWMRPFELYLGALILLWLVDIIRKPIREKEP